MYSLTVACYYGNSLNGQFDHRIYLKKPGEATEQICPKGTDDNIINVVDRNYKYQCCIIYSIQLNPGEISKICIIKGIESLVKIIIFAELYSILSSFSEYCYCK